MTNRKKIQSNKTKYYQKLKKNDASSQKAKVKSIEKTSLDNEIDYKTHLLNSNLIDKYIGKWGLPLFILFFILIGFNSFYEFLTLKYTYFFSDIGSDTINTFFPAINNTRNPQIGPHGISSWNFYIGMGQNSFWLPQDHPVRYVFAKINSFLSSYYGSNYGYSARFTGAFFTYMLFAGIFFFLYLKTLKMSTYVSIIGAILFSYTGYMVVGGTWGHYTYPFYASLILFSFEQLYKHNRWIFLPFSVVVFSHNAFHLYLYVGLFGVTYSAFRYYIDHGLKFKGYFILLSKMAFLVFIGLAINAVTILSNFLLMFNAPRVAGTVATIGSGAKNSIFTSENFEIYNVSERLTLLYRMFNSDLLGNGTFYKGWYNYLEAPMFYCGLLSLLAVPQIFIKRKRKEIIAYGALIGFWALISLVPFVRHAAQAFVGNYYKHGIDVFVPTIIIFVAVNALYRLVKYNYLNYKLLFLTFFVLLSLLYFPFLNNEKEVIDHSIRNFVALYFVLYTILLFIVYKIKKYKYLVQMAILIVVIIEITHFTSISISKRGVYSLEEIVKNSGGFNDGSIDAVNFLRKYDNSFYRVEKNYASGTSQHRSLNDPQIQGYFGTASYSSFNQRYYIEFLEGTGIIDLGVETQTRWAPGLAQRPLLQSLASVKYYIMKQQRNRNLFNNPSDQIHTVKDIKILRNKFWVPFGVAFDKYITQSDYDILLQDFINMKRNYLQINDRYVQLSRMQNPNENIKLELNNLGSLLNQYSNKMATPQIDVFMLRSLVLDDKSDKFDEISNGLTRLSISDTIANFNLNHYSALVQQLRADSIAIKKKSMSYFEGEIQTDRKKLLFFPIPWDMGWRARVNNKKTDVLIVDKGLLAIELEQGNNHVILEYIPIYYNATIIISRIAYVLFFLILLIKNWNNIRRIANKEFLTEKIAYIKSVFQKNRISA